MKRVILFVFMLLGVSHRCEAAGNPVPFRLYRNYLILTNCSVAGQAGLTAIIDTGTTETMVTLALMRRLALENWPDSATALTNEAPARGVRIPDFEMGPLRIQQLAGIAVDLSSISRELGIRPDVVVGMDVLRRTSFTIDYDKHAIEFGAALPMKHGAALAPGLRFALVDSDVLGRRMRLQVDTGFNGMLVYGNRLRGGAVPVDTGARVSGVAQASGVHSVASLKVRLGNWEAAHIPIAVMEGAPRDFDEFDGLVGPRFLGAKRVAFDFERRMLYWD